MAKSIPRSTKTAKRRPYEYQHEYGLGSGPKKAPARPAPRVKAASTRTKAR